MNTILNRSEESTRVHIDNRNKPEPTRYIKRKTADRILADLVQRAVVINKKPTDYLHRVTRLQVFGSYLGDKDRLGDIDVLVELEQIIWGPGSLEMALSLAKYDGRGYLPWLSQIRYPYEKTVVALRNKSKFLSLMLGPEFAEMRTDGKGFLCSSWIIFDGATGRITLPPTA